MKTLITLAVLALPLSAVAQDADQQAEADEPKAKTGVSRILGTLDWGAHYEDVLGHVKTDLDEKYAKLLEQVVDTLKIDNILKQKAKEFAEIKKTYVRFTGQRTGYETSLIADDFSKNNNESVLRIDEPTAQRYYFFKDDRLWKIVVAYNSSISRSVPFTDFVKQVQAKYDRPESVDWHTPPGGQKTIRSAVWTDDITHLSVEDRTGFFGTFVMKFVDKNQGLAIEQARLSEAKPGAVPGDPQVDSAMADIMVDEGGGEANVVDQLTGVNHKVDLESGVPAWERDQQPLERAAAEPAQKKKKKARKARRAPAKKKAPAKAPAADPVIIY